MVRRVVLTFGGLGLLASVGCGPSMRDKLEADLRTRAARAMSCPADQITLTPLTAEVAADTDIPMAQGADGCGKNQVYVYGSRHRRYVLNADSKPLINKP